MAELFRKSSAEKLSDPEQLDKMIKISSPVSWLALAAIFLIIAAAAAWAFFGTLPTTETIDGVIVSPLGVYAVLTEDAGTLTRFCVNIGDRVNAGDTIAEITLANGETRPVLAKTGGTFFAPTAELNAPVYVGTDVARVTPDCGGDKTVLCLVPLASAQKLKENMSARVYLASANSQQYGGMEATVKYVGEYASNLSSLEYVLGSGNLVAERFTSNGPAAAVICELKTDPSSANGYSWSKKNGETLAVPCGSMASVKVTINEQAPITKIIGNSYNA